MPKKKSIDITVYGEAIKGLTREKVEKAAMENNPGPIRKYVVNVCGKSWPPKQLISLTLGKTPDFFNAHQANQWLRLLDFDVREIKKD